MPENYYIRSDAKTLFIRRGAGLTFTIGLEQVFDLAVRMQEIADDRQSNFEESQLRQMSKRENYKKNKH